MQKERHIHRNNEHGVLFVYEQRSIRMADPLRYHPLLAVPEQRMLFPLPELVLMEQHLQELTAQVLAVPYLRHIVLGQPDARRRHEQS